MVIRCETGRCSACSLLLLLLHRNIFNEILQQLLHVTLIFSLRCRLLIVIADNRVTIQAFAVSFGEEAALLLTLVALDSPCNLICHVRGPTWFDDLLVFRMLKPRWMNRVLTVLRGFALLRNSLWVLNWGLHGPEGRNYASVLRIPSTCRFRRRLIALRLHILQHLVVIDVESDFLVLWLLVLRGSL